MLAGPKAAPALVTVSKGFSRLGSARLGLAAFVRLIGRLMGNDFMKTQVGIVGAGPAGLLLGRILQQHRIETVILERRSRDYVLARIRAGVLEQGTVDTLREFGVDERLNREGIPHQEMKLFWAGERHAIPMVGEGGRRLMTYGQNKIVEDLINLREGDGLPIIFEAEVEAIADAESAPVIYYTGTANGANCDVISSLDAMDFTGRRASISLTQMRIPSIRNFRFPGSAFLLRHAPAPKRAGLAIRSVDWQSVPHAGRKSAASICRLIPISIRIR